MFIKSRKIFFLRKLFILWSLCMACAVFIPDAQAASAASLKLKYNGKWHTYKKVQSTLYCNDKKVSFKDVPVIKLNGTYMASAKTFANAMGATYANDGKNITIQKDNIVISMKKESKVATVNNVNYNMSTYPRVVKNKSTKKSAVMIPVSFVAKKLGFGYKNVSGGKSLYIHTLHYVSAKTDKTLLTNESLTNEEIVTYINDITEVKADHIMDKGYDVFELKTTSVIDVQSATTVIDAQNHLVTVTLPLTYNGLGDSVWKLADSSLVKSIQIKQNTADFSTVIQISFIKKAQAYVAISENILTVNFAPLNYSMIMDKPKDVDFSSIKTEDLYHKKTFTITIPGDHREFYRKKPITVISNVVKSTKVSLTAYGDTKITVQTKKIQGFKLSEQDGNIIINIANPSKIYDKIVVLDPGHGGSDPGAIHNRTREKDLNYKILYTYAKTYFEKSDIKVYWTRTTDQLVNLYELAAFSKEVEADLYISLHMNSSVSSAANGTEVYYCKLNKNKTASGLDSKKMAKLMYNKLVSKLKTKRRGVHSANFVVVKYNSVPAILIELGFLSGNKDYKKLTKSSFQKKSAKTIYETVDYIFKKYPTGRE